MLDVTKVRLECLRLACEQGGRAEDIVTAAIRYEHFVTSSQAASRELPEDTRRMCQETTSGPLDSGRESEADAPRS